MVDVNLVLTPDVRSFQAMAEKFGGEVSKQLSNVNRSMSGGVDRTAAGESKQNVGQQLGKLARMMPAGGMMADVGKAFKQGGMMTGVTAGVVSIVGFFKSLLSQSKIFSTVAQTFFKIAGVMLDMMLMPLLPYFMRFLQWWLTNGVSWAMDMGKKIAEIVPQVISFFSTTKTVLDKILPFGGFMTWARIFFKAWFAIWLIQKAVGAVKAIGGAARGGLGLLKRLRGGGGAGKAVKGTYAQNFAKAFPKAGAKKVGLFGRMTGGIGRGLGLAGRGISGAGRGLLGVAKGGFGLGALGRRAGRLGGGRVGRIAGRLATRQGLKLTARVAGGFLAKRGGSMLAGAAIGGMIGGAAGGLPAIPGALIGAIAGLVIGQATGVAIDLATGAEITMMTALMPGMDIVRDIKKSGLVKDAEIMDKNAKKTQVAADRLNQKTERDVTEHYQKTLGASSIPDTVGSYIGIYEKMSEESELTESQVKTESKGLLGKIGGFFGKWAGKIGGFFKSAWGTVRGWWNRVFGKSDEEGEGGAGEAGAGTTDPAGGQPAKDPPDEEGGGIGGFFSGWAGKIGGFFVSGWNLVQGWWNKIFGDSAGAGTTPGGQPEKDPPDEEGGGISGFFGEWAGKIGGFFKDAWSTVSGWWNKITGGAEKEGQPKDDTPNEGGGGGLISFFTGWAGNIGTFFKDAWTTVSGWWNKITGGAEDNPPDEDLDPGDVAKPGSFFPDWLTGPIKGVVKLFKNAWGRVSGWWNKITGGAEDNPPDETLDPGDVAKPGSFFPDWLTNPISGVINLFKGAWSKVSGWWNKITGGAEDNKPDDDEPKAEGESKGIFGFFSGWKTGITTKFKNTWGTVKGWWNKIFNADEDDVTPDIEVDAPGAAGEKISLVSQIGTKLIDGVNKIIGVWNTIILGIAGWTINIPEFSWTIMEKKTLPGWAGGGSVGPFTIGWSAKKITPLDGLKSFSMGTIPGGTSTDSGGSNSSSYMSASGDGEGIWGRMYAGLENHYNSLKETHQENYDAWRNKRVIRALPTVVQAPAATVLAAGETILDVGGDILGEAKKKAGGVISKLNPFGWGGDDEDDEVVTPVVVKKPTYVSKPTNRYSYPRMYDADPWSYDFGGRQTGGVIPGPLGSPQIGLLHGGETVLPTHLGAGWMDSTKGGRALQKQMTGDGGIGTMNVMNKPTTINIYTTENAVATIENIERMQLMDEASFFTAM